MKQLVMHIGAKLILTSSLGLSTAFVMTQITGCAHSPKYTTATPSFQNRAPAQIEFDENYNSHGYSSNLSSDDEEDASIDYAIPENVYAANQVSDAFSDNVITFDWPVDSARLTRGFMPHATGKRKKPHLGLDLASAKGSPILASHDGTVIYVGQQFKGYGKMIMIEGAKGLATLYAHLSKTAVRAGQYVRKGDLIGKMGRTGRATGVHLHFEIRTEKGPIDPLLYLPEVKKFAAK